MNTYARPHRFGTILLGTIVLVIAVIISWYISLFVLYSFDIDAHYPNGDTSVRITSTGEKYHLSSCSYLHSSSIKITLENAYERGYGRCSRCDPPVFISIEDYQLAKAEQPLVLLIIGVPLLCVPIAFLSVMVIAKINDFLGVLDRYQDWFSVLLVCTIYIATLIQGLRMIIIW